MVRFLGLDQAGCLCIYVLIASCKGTLLAVERL